MAAKISKKLGSKIRKARRSMGLTQLELAHAIGHQGSDAGAHISRVESGSQQPRLDLLERIAKALKTPLEQLLTK